MTFAMKTSDRDTAYAVALVLLLAISLAAFFCDPHWQPLGQPRISWTAATSPRTAAAEGANQ
jgi:hypothetical protein